MSLPTLSKILWPEAPSQKQRFSLPDSLIYYILKNPSSPEGYLKLAQACKYFFENNPILVMKWLTYERGCGDTPLYTCMCRLARCTSNCCVIDVPLDKLKSKIWITEGLSIINGGGASGVLDVNELLRKLLYRCSADLIYIEDRQNKAILDYHLVKSLISKVTLFFLRGVKKIAYGNGEAVALEELFLHLNNIEIFRLVRCDTSSMVNADTLKRISKYKNLGRLKELVLKKLPEMNDIVELLKVFKNTKFDLEFDESISDAYKNHLRCLVDKFLEAKISNCAIRYDGQDFAKFHALYELYKSFKISDK